MGLPTIAVPEYTLTIPSTSHGATVETLSNSPIISIITPKWSTNAATSLPLLKMFVFWLEAANNTLSAL